MALMCAADIPVPLLMDRRDAACTAHAYSDMFVHQLAEYVLSQCAIAPNRVSFKSDGLLGV